tara:strand:- start:16158 stop:17390 length:1233 start_codon:yes stop_codon:yes gene_type:complete
MIKIAVVGIGTVGIQSLSHLLGFLDNNFEITAIYDPNIKILGVGESSQPDFLVSLHKGANFKITEDAHHLDATIKLGAKWINWRKEDFTMTLDPPFMAMHFNNFKLKEFCFQRFKQLWKEKFQIIKGNVSSIENINGNYAQVNVDDKSYNFDFVMDCRGYPEDFSNYETVESIPVNHALIHVKDTPGDWTTTINQATEHGWMFGLPLQTRNAWGYLYNDTISSKQEVVDDMCKIFKLDESNLNLKEFSFKNYKAKQYFDGRVMLNGNRALFYEPLEALANGFYNNVIRNFFDYVTEDKSISNFHSVPTINNRLTQLADSNEMFINFIYHGGSNFNSKFWKFAKQNCSIFLNQSVLWKRTNHDVKKIISNTNATSNDTVSFWKVHHWKDWDEKLTFDYFKNKRTINNSKEF